VTCSDTSTIKPPAAQLSLLSEKKELSMIVSTTDSIPGKEIKEILGIARGNVVRAKHIGKDIMASLKGIVGGEIEQYTELMTDARDQAFKRMVTDAQNQGANAVINVRFVTSMIAQTMSELLAYGTAVRYE
jgi:uncharacterized protein YbjQ (UPF0145 family)